MTLSRPFQPNHQRLQDTIATAGDVPKMAQAFKKAIEAGRESYLAGFGDVVEKGARASSPLTGFLHD